MTQRPKPVVAVVGAGAWGRNHVRNFHSLGVLAAVCDPSRDALDQLRATTPGVQLTTEIESILRDASVNSVVVATPAATHGSVARRCLEAGKHVFVEKPLCLDAEEALTLGALADARGLVLMVGHLLLYHPAFNALGRMVKDGGLGQLRYVYSNRASLGKVRVEENALWSFAPHDVSMILALVGRLPARVLATGANYITDGVADMTLSHLAFSKDLQAHIFVSWLHPYKDHRMVVIGSNGMIVFNDVAEGADKLLLYRHVATTNSGVPVVTRAKAEPIPYEADEPLRLECQHFLNCVETGARPRSDAAEGYRVLRVLQACEQSIVLGRAVEVGSNGE